MTPCQRMGWKQGDQFIVINGGVYFRNGETVMLVYDDGSHSPLFKGEGATWKDDGRWFIHIDNVTPSILNLENE